MTVLAQAGQNSAYRTGPRTCKNPPSTAGSCFTLRSLNYVADSRDAGLFLLEFGLVLALVEHELCVVDERKVLGAVLVFFLADSLVRSKTVRMVLSRKE